MWLAVSLPYEGLEDIDIRVLFCGRVQIQKPVIIMRKNVIEQE